jgi:putative RecB family exonuclease
MSMSHRVEDQPRSVSQLHQYEECPLRYYLVRVERVEPRPAAWSIHGTAFHEVAEAVELSEGAVGEEEAVELFSDIYAHGIQEALDREPDTDRWLAAGRSGGEDIEHRYVLGQTQAARYVQWTAERPTALWRAPGGQLAVEVFFEVELAGVPVRGYIDQLIQEQDGTVRVRDLKTGSTKSRFQLETYKVAAERAWGVTVRTGDWYLARNGGLSRALDLTEVSEADVSARYVAMDRAVKQGNFPARPGFHCNFCDVSHVCAAKSRVDAR